MAPALSPACRQASQACGPGLRSRRVETFRSYLFLCLLIESSSLNPPWQKRGTFPPQTYLPYRSGNTTSRFEFFMPGPITPQVPSSLGAEALPSSSLSTDPSLAGQRRDFPGRPVVRILLSNAGGVGLIPGRGAGIPHSPQAKKSKT